MLIRKTLVERFFSFVVKGEATHHYWLWCGAIGDDGYGRFWVKDLATGKGRVSCASFRHATCHEQRVRTSLSPLNASTA